MLSSKFCDECGKEVKTKVITKRETYDVCGESIEIDASVLVCSECGEELFCEELDNDTLVRVYNEYRRRHKLLMPEEIKKIREQYDLSQRSFAKLLNWGDKTIHRYENGAIQDRAHNSLLVFLRDPENMRTYLNDNEVSLDEKQRNKLLNTINKLEKNLNVQDSMKLFNSIFSCIPCEENGFKEFDYEKICAMVLFFANKCQDLLKTKLMKLLNYSDMIFYQKFGISMSGLKYIHLQYGPVPDNFDMLLWKMAKDHIAHIDLTCDKRGYEKQHIIPERDIPDEVLSAEEADVLQCIYEQFKNLGSVAISNRSHQEKGYKETEQGEVISYAYAKYIELN